MFAVHFANRHGIRELPETCPLLSFLDTGGNTGNGGKKISIYEATTFEAGMRKGEGLVEEAVQRSNRATDATDRPWDPRSLQAECLQPRASRYPALNSAGKLVIGGCSQPSQSRVETLNQWFSVRDILPPGR